MHHWKVWLTTFAVLGIAALLFFRTGMGTDLGGIFSSFVVKLNPMPTGNAFPIELQASLSKFQGSNYDVVNISVRATGICIDTKLSSSMDFEQKGGVCKFSADSASGKLGFSNGMVVLDTDVISAKVRPESLLISGLAMNKMSLLDVTGSMKTFRNKEWDLLLLKGDNIDASGVIGNMKIEGDSVTVNALVVSVKVDSGDGSSITING